MGDRQVMTQDGHGWNMGAREVAGAQEGRFLQPWGGQRELPAGGSICTEARRTRE